MGTEVVAPEGQLPAERPSETISLFEKYLKDPAVDAAKLEKMIELQERIENRNAEKAFNIAMSAAQAEMRQIKATEDNEQTRSKYATYQALDRALRPIYIKHQFSLSFGTEDSPADSVKVVCHVAHNAGHSRKYQVLMPADGKGAKGGDVMTKTHATGSAVSYGMRYLLKMIFNAAVGDDDDDGNAAGAEVITEEQAKILKDLLAETKANIPKFLEIYKIKTVEELHQRAFGDAHATLLHKKAVQAKEAAKAAEKAKA